MCFSVFQPDQKPLYVISVELSLPQKMPWKPIGKLTRVGTSPSFTSINTFIVPGLKTSLKWRRMLHVLFICVAVMFITLSKLHYDTLSLFKRQGSLPSKISVSYMCFYRAGQQTAVAQHPCHVSTIFITLSKHGTVLCYICSSDCTELPRPVSHQRSGTLINADSSQLLPCCHTFILTDT